MSAAACASARRLMPSRHFLIIGKSATSSSKIQTAETGWRHEKGARTRVTNRVAPPDVGYNPHAHVVWPSFPVHQSIDRLGTNSLTNIPEPSPGPSGTKI